MSKESQMKGRFAARNVFIFVGLVLTSARTGKAASDGDNEAHDMLRGIVERQLPPSNKCGDGNCKEAHGETCVTCPDDCGECGPPPTPAPTQTPTTKPSANPSASSKPSANPTANPSSAPTPPASFNPFLKHCTGTNIECTTDSDCLTASPTVIPSSSPSAGPSSSPTPPTVSSSGRCGNNNAVVCTLDEDCPPNGGPNQDFCVFPTTSNVFIHPNRRTSSATSTCEYAYADTASEQPDYSKPTKVFIMMGQSNMVGFGKVEDGNTPGTLRYLVNEGKYTHLVGDQGEWITRSDVQTIFRNSYCYQANTNCHDARPLAVGHGNKHNCEDDPQPCDPVNIGPELGFGHVLGHILEEDVIIIKVGTGRRALGWDFLPPLSERYWDSGVYPSGSTTTRDLDEPRSFPGHGECPESSRECSGDPTNACLADDTSSHCGTCTGSLAKNCSVYWPEEYCKPSSEGGCFGWYAGMQYDRDINNAREVLNNLQTYYPDYNGTAGFEIGGFVFWQGHRDWSRIGHAKRYEQNNIRFIEQLRADFSEYDGDKKYVQATIAFGGCNGYSDIYTQERHDLIYNAQLNMNAQPAFAGIAKTVDALTYWRDAAESPGVDESHYNYNAETYYEVGNALGWAMADLFLGSNELVESHCP